MSEIIKKGSLNINSENMFPIIRKWLYQDHDIFFRELISNGCDAVTKLKKLSLIGEYEAPEDEKYRIDITVDPDNHCIYFEDNGIGMDADEVDSYINQVAFSGAADFISKYKDKANEDQIIGHFGLGFYSAFMVADRVTIDSLSYKKDAEPVLWVSEDGCDFEMSEGARTSHGTTITLHISDDELKFCNEYQAREIIEKYCSFMPVEIYLKDAAKLRKDAEEAAKKAAEEASKATASDAADAAAADESAASGDDATVSGDENVAETVEFDADGKTKTVEEAGDSKENHNEAAKAPEEKPLNDIHPLWNESPSKVTEEQYKEFYKKVFRDYREPLFWIHLNMDYPFNLKGILYFPKINNRYENIEGTIKLYNNQVFIADNIKEVIPEYLLLLKGTIDCPDLPLNVSRSALQNDGFVQKISDYITKKVADKLTGMFKTDRENYEKYWDDISPFIKYGCIRDTKFGDKMKDAIIFKDLDDKYLTAGEYMDGKKTSDSAADSAEAKSDAAGNAVETDGAAGGTDGLGTIELDNNAQEAGPAGAAADNAAGNAGSADEAQAGDDNKKANIFYVTNVKEQSQYIRMFKKAGKNAVIMDFPIDVPFISYFESKFEKYNFVRIDADLTEDFKEDAADAEAEKQQNERLIELFRKAADNKDLDVKVEKLKDESVASLMTMSEEGRRMQDMLKMYAMYGMDTGKDTEPQTLVLNSRNKLVKRLAEELNSGSESELSKDIAAQLYDMALLSRGGLTDERMEKFILRSQELMMKL